MTNAKIKTSEIYGQYANDRINGLVNDPHGTLDARGDGDLSLHNTGLWDEEDLHTPDPATGTAEKVPTDIEEGDLAIVVPGLGREALLGIDDNDAAARWLAANDPDYKK